MMQLDEDFSEFVALLAAHDVRYMIVGGYALAAHGLPRATGDLDAWTRHIQLVLGGVTVPFIGRTDLIVNKRAVGRPQDVADVKRLTEHPG
ncbi:MAG: hypothetical protein WCH93_11500 [Actinomycetota bacterium]